MQILKSDSSISKRQVSRFRNAWIKAYTNVIDMDEEYKDAESKEFKSKRVKIGKLLRGRFDWKINYR